MSTAPGATLSVNFPCASVTVPVPFTTVILMAGSGAPVSSVTVPEIVFSCACDSKGDKRKINNSLRGNNGTVRPKYRIGGISNQFCVFNVRQLKLGKKS